MNRETLFKSIGQVDEQTLIETESYKKMPSNRVVFRLIAASLAIVLMVFGFSYLFPKDHSSQTLSSWFVITAQAAEGDWNKLDLNDGFFNSGGTNQTISLFPADVPLFEFVIKPSAWDKYQEEYWNFVIEVSYNGNIVDSLDDHIVVFHQIPIAGSDAPYAHEVKGWVEEPTDIVITISDRESGMLVEQQTVHVCYVPESHAYELTVTNVQTNDMNK